MIQNIAGTVAIASTPPLNGVYTGADGKDTPLKGNIHHSVSQWRYVDIQVEIRAGMNLMKHGNNIIMSLCWLS